MKKILLAAFLLSVTGLLSAQSGLTSAGIQFLKSLRSTQKEKVLLPGGSQERYLWHFYPKDDRKGLSLIEMSPEQQSRLYALMHDCFSRRGFDQVRSVMQMEAVLKAQEKRPESDHYRDTGKYFCLFFGEPGRDSIWSWRLEGHHVSFSFVISQDVLLSATPGFLGSNPAVVQEGPATGKEVFKEETALAFELLQSMGPENMKRAVISTKAPGEILSFVSRKAVIENPDGIYYAQMKPVERQMLMRLVELYIYRYSRLFADDMLKEIHMAGLDKIRFSWAGTRDRASHLPYYYRIMGPTFLIEFDNAQDNANHIHTVVRDLQHDFGGDLLLEHYRREH